MVYYPLFKDENEPFELLTIEFIELIGDTIGDEDLRTSLFPKIVTFYPYDEI